MNILRSKNMRIDLLIIFAIALPGLQGCMDYAKKYEQSIQSIKSGYESYESMGEKKPAQAPSTQSAQTNSKAATGQKTAAGATAEQELVLLMQQQGRWHEREDYFKKLKFDAGEYKVINSPNNNFTNLYIPMHKGLPRVGATPSFGVSKAKQYKYKNDPNLYIKLAFSERLQRDMNTYIALNYLAQAKKLAMPKRLKADNSGQPHNKPKRDRDIFSYKGYFPRYNVEYLASTLLSPTIYEQYLCQDNKPCDKNSMPRNGRSWGGVRADEFRARKKYYAFVDTIVPEMIAWGDKLSATVYLISRARLGEYDYDKQAFKVTVVPHKSALTYVTKKRMPEFFKGMTGLYHTFLPMSEAKAEAFGKRLRAESQGELYAVLKLKIDNFKTRKSNYGNRAKLIDFQARAVENKITFYFDEALKEKVFESSKFE